MADTFNNDLRVREQEAGSNSGTWGGLLNTTISNLASAFGQGSEAIPNASTHTITLADGAADEARSMYLKCTGGGQACTVTLAPNTISKVWIISNETSFTLTFSQGSGANVAVAAGAVKMIVTDGAGATGAVTDALSGLEGAFSTVTADGGTIVSTGSDAFSSKAVGGYAIQAYQDATSSGHTALDLRSDATTDTRYLIRGYNDAAGTPTEVFSVGADGSAFLNSNLGIGTSSPSEPLTVLSAQDYQITAAYNAANSTSYGYYGIKNNNTGNPFYFNVGGAERMRITSAGSVGIGTTTVGQFASTNVGLTVDSGNAYSGIAMTDGATTSTLAQGYSTTYLYNQANGSMLFGTNNTEAMRLDSSGNLLVGKTSTSIGTAGHTIFASGEVFHTVAGTPLYVNRTGSDGPIQNFYKDGATVGSIGNSGTRFVVHGTFTSGAGLYFGSNVLLPTNNAGTLTDGVTDLGQTAFRFDDIYATNGTIQTSDRNQKQDIAELSDAEQRVAVAAKGLLRKFRWISSVEENGDDARIHFGIIAQDLQDAFTAEGLDAGRYAMFISSTWTDEDTGEERTRLGVRYSELLAFIISAI